MSQNEPQLIIRRASLPVDPLPERDVKPTGAGAVAEDPLDRNDERRERAAFGSGQRRKVEPPDWFLELARSRAAPDTVFQILSERLPEIEDPELLRLMVNEMGRLEEAQDSLKRHVTPEAVRRLHPEG
jgi:hypothetical protein